MYLDCDTTPPLRSRFLEVRTTKSAVKKAKIYIGAATEGQIGIYENSQGVGFKGYVIKYAGQEPYFEPAE
jgi:hypothetical protein